MAVWNWVDFICWNVGIEEGFDAMQVQFHTTWTELQSVMMHLPRVLVVTLVSQGSAFSSFFMGGRGGRL